MKPINVEKTHGHSIGISSHYYRPQESEVLEDYLIHAADALTINPTQRLEQENQDLKTVQAEQLNKQAQQIATLQKGIEEGRARTIRMIKGMLTLARDSKNKEVIDPSDLEMLLKEYSGCGDLDDN